MVRTRLSWALIVGLWVWGIASCAHDNGPLDDEEIASTRAALSVSSTVQAAGDTYLRNGAPNQNQGGDLVLRVQSSGNNRVLVFFNNAAITSSIGSGTLLHAELELPIDNTGTNWGASGRP